jgi:glycerate 2-kinase
MTPRQVLRAAMAAGLAAADAGVALAGHLPPRPRGRVLVAGAGKASAAMAAALETTWAQPLGLPVEGLVVTQQGYGRDLSQVRLVEASHPLPGLEAQAAAAETLVRASMLGEGDLMIVLLSGGGSALWPAPRRPLDLDAKRAITVQLLRSGAPIAEVNAIRKHLSRIKGGRLAKAAGPCAILALAVSDVPGDDPGLIASGPLSPDPVTNAEARAMMERRGIPVDDAVAAVLADPASETPKPGAPCFDRVDFRIVLRSSAMLAAVAQSVTAAGYRAVVLGDALEGEARDVGAAHASLALKAQSEGGRIALISGGELTVTMTGNGRGGPNREYTLALALALKGADGIVALAIDTDGADGGPDAAGAIVDATTLTRARTARIDAPSALRANDSGAFFDALGDAIVTGPTATNVNDLRVILIE